MTKEKLLLTECVYPFHEMFQNPIVSMQLKKYEETLEGISLKLTEQAMAHASNGLYSWTDESGEDYDDHSDQKTGAMRPRHYHGGGSAELVGLSTPSGNEKNGAVRGIIHNQYTNRLDYFYFPKDVWLSRSTPASNGKLRLQFSYSGYTDTYVWWAEDCRYYSFKDLAIAC
jgi:hypothetical protein